MSTEISIGCGVSMYTIGQALSNIETIYSNLSLPPVDVGHQPLKTPPIQPITYSAFIEVPHIPPRYIQVSDCWLGIAHVN